MKQIKGKFIEYAANPVKIKAFKGTGVQESLVSIGFEKIKFKNKENLKEVCKTGYDDKNKSKFPVAVRFKEGNNQISCRILIDTRHALLHGEEGFELPDELAQDFKFLNVELFDTKEDKLECLLALDLGNTRSYAILVDDIRDDCRNSNDPKIHELPLFSRISPEWGAIERGVFESIITLCHSAHVNGVLKKFAPFSFMTIGLDALYARRILTKSEEPGDFSLSSPKRYFWCEDPHPAGWKSVVYDDGSFDVLSLNGPLADELRGGGKTLSRSGILSGMIVEIIEQAERFANSFLFMSATGFFRPRTISEICITYPASWSNSEVRQYKNTIERGIKAFSSKRSLPVPRLDISCDESSAVMLNYIYGEVRKYGGVGENWILSVGRKDPEHLGANPYPTARIAVIDIGGGTSDLVIADVTDTVEGNGIQLDIQRRFHDGINKAGDIFLREIVREIALPKVSDELFKGIDKDSKEASAKLGDYLNTNSNDPSVKNLARSFWFPLAIKILEKCKGNNKDIKIDLSGIIEYAGDLEELAKSYFPRVAVTEIKNKEIDFSDISDIVRKIARKTFSGVAKSFGSAISAFDCDIVLFAGKASEVEVIKEVFKSAIPLPEDKFIPLWNYYIGDWCSLAKNGIIADPKVTTVLGAAVYSLANLRAPCMHGNIQIKTSSAPGIEENNALWGIITNGNPDFDIDKAILTREKEQVWIPFYGSTLIARKRFPAQSYEASPSYELRLNPGKARKRRAGTGVRVELSKKTNSDDSVTLIVSNAIGTFDDGTPVNVDDLELRHRIFTDDAFWLDSGKI